MPSRSHSSSSSRRRYDKRRRDHYHSDHHNDYRSSNEYRRPYDRGSWRHEKRRRVSEDRTWRFDSPPRDDTIRFESYGFGMGLVAPEKTGSLTLDGVKGTVSRLIESDVTSPMSVMASSLSLTPEQQRAARELYVGNLPPDLELNQLIEFFNAALLALKIIPWQGNPVVRAWIASDYSFIELRTIEEASLALTLNGISCLGYSLRIGRTKTYPAQYASLISALPSDVPGTGPPTCPAAALAAATAAAQGVGSVGPQSSVMVQAAAVGLRREERPERLVILDLRLDEGSTRKTLGVHGVLKVFQYFECGICIFEYTRTSEERSFLEAPFEEGRVVTAAEAVKENRLNEVMKEAVGGDLMKPQVATRCVMLSNMVTVDEVKDDKEYYDIIDDVSEEAKEFGRVIAVKIPRPDTSEYDTITDSDVGYAFIEFDSIEAAGKARRSLSGRKFGGRQVEASYYSEIRFKKGDFKDPKPNDDPTHSTARNPSLASHIQEDTNTEETTDMSSIS